MPSSLCAGIHAPRKGAAMPLKPIPPFRPSWPLRVKVVRLVGVIGLATGSHWGSNLQQHVDPLGGKRWSNQIRTGGRLVLKPYPGKEASQYDARGLALEGVKETALPCRQIWKCCGICASRE
jgi:hypothetical protein